MKRYGSVIGIPKSDWAEYERYHAAVWPEVLKIIYDCNIGNYSIYRYGELLFSYFEYVGNDYQADIAKMGLDPKTQDWWDVMKPMQRPVPESTGDEWWHSIPEVFHMD